MVKFLQTIHSNRWPISYYSLQYQKIVVQKGDEKTSNINCRYGLTQHQNLKAKII